VGFRLGVDTIFLDAACIKIHIYIFIYTFFCVCVLLTNDVRWYYACCQKPLTTKSMFQLYLFYFNLFNQFLERRALQTIFNCFVIENFTKTFLGHFFIKSCYKIVQYFLGVHCLFKCWTKFLKSVIPAVSHKKFDFKTLHCQYFKKKFFNI
jgi:hypothetical protein